MSWLHAEVWDRCGWDGGVCSSAVGADTAIIYLKSIKHMQCSIRTCCGRRQPCFGMLLWCGVLTMALAVHNVVRPRWRILFADILLLDMMVQKQGNRGELELFGSLH